MSVFAPSTTIALPHSSPAPAWRWDLFCRVIDNYGDIGVCWRLARHLVALGQQVRLWVDDPGALAWMAPSGTDPIEVLRWQPGMACPPVADVVVECFGCDPPSSVLADMATRDQPPVWINLEYLSAETYVERSHRLRSPQRVGPDRWLDKWFFYPGFTSATGGLLREASVTAEPADSDGTSWLASRSWAPGPAEQVVSLFCYDNPRLPELLERLVEQHPTLLLSAPGPATEQMRTAHRPAGLRHIALPWLSQDDYDRLLRSCHLNLVRGEDSFVRAQWAGRPFLWQIYPQEDGVHAGKLAAFLDLHLGTAAPPLKVGVRHAMQAWNGLGGAMPGLPPLPEWEALARAWRAQLLRQAPLAQQLLDFVALKR